MKNQTNSKKIILTYGLISGAIAIAIALITYGMDKVLNPGILLSSLSFILPLVLVVLGIKKFKDSNNKLLKWGEAIKIGIGIALIWGILTLSFQYVLENIIDPDLLDQKLEMARETLENWGMDDDVIDTQLEKQKNQNPFLGISMGILLFTFIGFVVSAITGAIMKKEETDEY